MARKTLTDTGVAALKPHAKFYAHPDPQCPGHYVRVSPTGSKSFVAVARDPSGKQRWVTIGNAAHLSVDGARAAAREIITNVKAGQDHSGPQSFESVSRDWLKRHCEAKGLLSTPGLRRYLQNSVWPDWGGRDFTSIKRSDVAKLLDKVQDESGPVAADKVLAIASSVFNWYATRHDDYNSPIVRGMRRTKPKDRARERTLSDDEIRLIWSKCEGTFGDLVKMLLLTGQRRAKVAAMKWSDLSDGVWTIANGNKREKGTGGQLVLPAIALDIIRSRPSFASNPYVFPGATGVTYYKTFDRGKQALDEATGPLPHWQTHDLRRTARTLMSRAGVNEKVAERVLGHVMGGVEGIYNRHQYKDEKAYALRALAGLIDNILRPEATEVVRLRG
jgi:integrase